MQGNAPSSSSSSAVPSHKPAAQKQYVDITSNLVPEVDEFSLFYSNPKQSGFQRYWARLWQYPLLPVGLIATAGILVGGLRSMTRGDDGYTQNRWMRARIISQGITIGLFFYYTGMFSPAKWAEENKQREERRKIREGEIPKPQKVETIK